MHAHIRRSYLSQMFRCVTNHLGNQVRFQFFIFCDYLFCPACTKYVILLYHIVSLYHTHALTSRPSPLKGNTYCTRTWYEANINWHGKPGTSFDDLQATGPCAQPFDKDRAWLLQDDMDTKWHKRGEMVTPHKTMKSDLNLLSATRSRWYDRRSSPHPQLGAYPITAWCLETSDE